ncbi:MAG: mechanosensitive ion channel family protein [Candidatus Gracilibacteria bacterium]
MKKILSLFSAFSAATILMISSVSTTFAASITDSASTAKDTASGIASFLSILWGKAPSWVAAILVFFGSFFVAKMIRERAIDHFTEKFADNNQDAVVLIGRVTYVTVLTIGITVALRIGGLDLTALIAAVGFGLGFAMQDLVMNFIAGILILLNRPFSIGDFIKVGSTMGKVIEIQGRATILKAVDGTRVIVPNSDLFKNQVVNFTANPFRRVEITSIGITYNDDIAHASRVIMAALKENTKILAEPAPTLILSDFGDYSVDFKIRFWVDSHTNWMKIKSEVLHTIKLRMEEHGVQMPYPTQTLLFSRETEDAVVPTHNLSLDEVARRNIDRSKEEEKLATEIEASAKMAKEKGIPSFLPPKPKKPIPEETDLDLIVTGPAVPPDALEPPAGPMLMPKGDIDTGTKFLQSQDAVVVGAGAKVEEELDGSKKRGGSPAFSKLTFSVFSVTIVVIF